VGDEPYAGVNWDITAIDARNNRVQSVQSNARVTIQGATMVAVIPRVHFGVSDPRRKSPANCPLEFSRAIVDRHGGAHSGVRMARDAQISQPVRPSARMGLTTS